MAAEPQAGLRRHRSCRGYGTRRTRPRHLGPAPGLVIPIKHRGDCAQCRALPRHCARGRRSRLGRWQRPRAVRTGAVFRIGRRERNPVRKGLLQPHRAGRGLLRASARVHRLSQPNHLSRLGSTPASRLAAHCGSNSDHRGGEIQRHGVQLRPMTDGWLVGELRRSGVG